MNQLALNSVTKDYDPACGDLLAMAERELTAFCGAVTALFGSEQAEISAEDWLQELMAININDLRNNDLQNNGLHTSTRQWRLLTVKASARLASRVNASFDALATH
jgi:hypothetical protein